MSGIIDFLTGEDIERAHRKKMKLLGEIKSQAHAQSAEIARLTADLSRANERLGQVMALLGDWQAIPVRDHGHGDVAARTHAFMEATPTQPSEGVAEKRREILRGHMSGD